VLPHASSSSIPGEFRLVVNSPSGQDASAVATTPDIIERIPLLHHDSATTTNTTDTRDSAERNA
jgi:hypothetical protein